MKITIIDDQKANLDFFKDILKNEFSVSTFIEPLEAINFIVNNSQDLILLDCVMPGMNGHEVLKLLKFNFPTIPVIMISGFRFEDNLEKALEALVDDFIYKPVMADELIARIKNKIEKARNNHKEFNSFKEKENIFFNDNNETVSFDNVEYKLKGKEYRLLKFLVARKNHLVTREEIFVNVWEDSYVSPATLDTHLCQIRKKLDKHGDRIMTKKNAGFIYSSQI